jgi:hypothetical protein
MDAWLFALTPIALLTVLSLIRFVGCKFSQTLSVSEGTSYGDVVKAEPDLVSYWRLGETAGTGAGAAATDEKVTHNGTYRTFDLQANPVALSPATAHPPILAAGQPSLLPSDTVATSVRVDGGYVEVAFAPDLNPAQFTIEAVVHPEWAPTETGVFRCVIASRDEVTTPQIRHNGFILYAGPTLDPVTAQIIDSVVRWQAWVGTGVAGEQWQWVVGPPVEPGTTYLAATCDGTKLRLYAANMAMDLDAPRIERDVTYGPNSGKPLYIGMGATERPVPTPGPLYPFKGLIQEVAVYRAVLSDEAILKHLMTAAL